MLFIARWSVHAGYRDVVQTEVNDEMGAMVYQVVEDHRADHSRARHGENRIAGLQQRPRAIDVLRLGDRLPRGSDVAIEHIQDFRPGGRFRGSRSVGTAADGRDVERRRVQNHDNPVGDVRDVVGVPADRVRSRVRLPVKFVIWNALEHLERAGHLLIELGQNRFGVRHGILPGSRLLLRERQSRWSIRTSYPPDVNVCTVILDPQFDNQRRHFGPLFACTA
jgi:hypothetical protein